MKAKICGVKDEKTLRFILEHKYPPDFIGFISNFPTSVYPPWGLTMNLYL